MVCKLGKCPDSVGSVLRVELGNEDKALIDRALQEVVVWSETKSGKSPQCVLDSLGSEVLQLRHGSRHNSTQQWHSCSTGSAFTSCYGEKTTALGVGEGNLTAAQQDLFATRLQGNKSVIRDRAGSDLTATDKEVSPGECPSVAYAHSILLMFCGANSRSLLLASRLKAAMRSALGACSNLQACVTFQAITQASKQVSRHRCAASFTHT